MPEIKPVDEWKIDDAQAALDAETTATLGSQAAYDANHAYAETGDHWQDGTQWIGPKGTAATQSAVLEKVKRQHTPSDVIGEACTNMANGLLGQEADIDFVPRVPAGPEGTPSEAQARDADLLLAAFSAWWDARGFWELAGTAARRACWAARASLRVWIPPGFRVVGRRRLEDGRDEETRVLPTGLTLAQALARIEVAAPTPDHALVYVEPDTRREASAFFYTDAEGEKRAEVAFLAQPRALAPEGAPPVTIVRVLTDEANAAPDEYTLPLGGRLPVVEMRTRLLITEPVRRQQARLNFFESLLNRVGETAGFPERYVGNAEPSGIWLDYPPDDGPPLDSKPDDAGKMWYLHPGARTLGSAITTELVGIADKQPDGTIERATPSVTKFDPTDPEYAIKACRYARETILRACFQGHLAEGEADAVSGESKRQSRAQFERELKRRKAPLEGLIRETLETVLAHAALMSEDARRLLAEYRCAVTLHVNAGPPTSEEQEAAREQFKAGLLSDASAMALAGVEDVAAEQARIASSPLSVLALWEARGRALKALSDAGATDLRGAAKLIGLTDEEAETLVSFGAATVEQ